jgi:hypothetical protein
MPRAAAPVDTTRPSGSGFIGLKQRCAGVWQQLHHLLLDQLGREGQLDWSRASLDSLSARQAGAA